MIITVNIERQAGETKLNDLFKINPQGLATLFALLAKSQNLRDPASTYQGETTPGEEQCQYKFEVPEADVKKYL